MSVCWFPQTTASVGLRSATTRLSICSRGKRQQRLFLPVLCSIPARDVVIDFGKHKGCRMGILPLGYLRWLVREADKPRLSAWADYAKQVLEDPYYRDRLEWQSIERFSHLSKGAPPVAGASVKNSMVALGWDVSDQHAWSKVNFSLLGTTAGGRIPRRDNCPSSSKPKPTISKPKTGSPKPTMEASTNMLPSRGRLPGNSFDPPLSYLKSTRTSTISNSKLTSTTDVIGEPECKPESSRSLSLQEELLRRRRLRRERSAPKSSKIPPLTTENVCNLFPGRDSLMRRARRRADT